MTERESRLDEVQKLETYLDQNQITAGPLRAYVKHRRSAIAIDHPDEAQAAGAAVPGSQANDAASVDEPKPTEQPSGEGTQSPTPDATTEAAASAS